MSIETAAEPGSVKLARFSPQLGQPYGDKSVSPFSIKVETFLRMANIDYLAITPSLGAIMRNKKRKLPTIINDRGDMVVDSTFIIDHLMNTEPYASNCQLHLLDATLTPQQIASGTCLKLMCEESLYFIIGYWRYVFEPGFKRYCEINPTMTELGVSWIKRPAEWFARRAIVKQLWAQGTGRHTQNEVEYLGNACIDTIEITLNESHECFLFGGKASSFDATLFAFLSAILEIDLPCPLQKHARTKPRLIEYVHQINNRYGWPG